MDLALCKLVLVGCFLGLLWILIPVVLVVVLLFLVVWGWKVVRDLWGDLIGFLGSCYV